MNADERRYEAANAVPQREQVRENLTYRASRGRRHKKICVHLRLNSWELMESERQALDDRAKMIELERLGSHSPFLSPDINRR